MLPLYLSFYASHVGSAYAVVGGNCLVETKIPENRQGNFFCKSADASLCALRISGASFCAHVVAVIFSRANEKMIWINTSAIVATMKDTAFWGDRAFGQLICQTMSLNLLVTCPSPDHFISTSHWMQPTERTSGDCLRDRPIVQMLLCRRAARRIVWNFSHGMRSIAAVIRAGLALVAPSGPPIVA